MKAKHSFQGKPRRGLRWRKYWWVEELRARIENGQNHLKRDLIQTEPYKKEKEERA